LRGQVRPKDRLTAMIKLAAALVTACVAIADPSYSASFDCHPIGSDKCPEAIIFGSTGAIERRAIVAGHRVLDQRTNNKIHLGALLFALRRFYDFV
jgi:hypothetical protein